MNDVLKTTPAVFAVADTYHIMVPVNCESLMWVRVGNRCYFDESNGIIRSKVTTHRMIVPAKELDKAGKYKVCFRKVIERKPYFTETEDVVEIDFDFYPVNGESIKAYHISDSHNMTDLPIASAKLFEKECGKIDFLILNGDIPDHSGDIENFDVIYKIVEGITGGNIPTVFSRGNHDTRGIYAENIADHTPCDNGKAYYSFRLGSLWGLVLDCGEDKDDSHEEYGNTVCCHEFRIRETEYIENVIKNAKAEYDAEGVTNKIIIAHIPFTRQSKPPFNIEENIYADWAKMLRENVKPDIMLCGHTHEFSLDMPGCENDYQGQACPVVVGAYRNYGQGEFAGSGFIFEKEKTKVIFNDSEKIWETFELVK